MNILERYFRYRQNLIDQYLKGDLTKAEYLRSNLDAVLSLNINPFKNIDTVEKGLFNYQYYNAFAKEATVNAKRAATKEEEFIYREKANYHYYKKDRATSRILQLLDYTNVEAYFIRVHSKALRGKLFEIVLKDYNNMILHSQNDAILNRLKEENVFLDKTKISLIDDYINRKY